MLKLLLAVMCISVMSLCANPGSTVMELKGGYFFFVDSTMRDIYPQGVDVQLSRFDPLKTWGKSYSLGIYSAIEFIHCNGRSLNDNEHTAIWELPVSLGIQPVFRFGSRLDYYFSLGPRFFYVQQNNHSHFVNRTNSRGTFGGFFNTGARYRPTAHLIIDLFGEYSYGRLHVGSHKKHSYSVTRQIGGCVFGAGMGYSF